MKKGKIISMIIEIVFLFLGCLIFFSVLWALNNFGEVSVNAMVYTLTTSTDGTDTSVYLDYVISALLPSLAIVVLVNTLYYYLLPKFLGGGKNKVINVINHLTWALGVFILVGALVFANGKYDVLGYLQAQNQSTNVFKETKKKPVVSEGDQNIVYAEANDVKVTGSDTRNLIYIYMESMENSYMDVANGGYKTTNHMPELTQLEKENTSFSYNGKCEGPIDFEGTSWTIASMVSQQTGLPLKTSLGNDMNKQTYFMPGARGIGDILEENNYKQVFFSGTNGTFAGTDKFYKEHGNIEVIDENVIKSKYNISSSDYQSWGIKDYKLLECAKTELTNLSSSNQKFSFNMATIDPHTPNGYPCKYCPKEYSTQYENVVACQSKLVSEFVEWCKQQPWYANTTIVLCGDHNSMASSHFNDCPAEYTRTTYNCIINSKITASKQTNRVYTRFDMFPTTLAAMGFTIEGNKLGLGTNLFSSLKTNVEVYGVDYIKTEISKQSDYLDKQIYKFN
ncbi:MAG: LTA synthase family protein [Thomasclavelia sp.]|nr:LTA synthase family protein [Thomasclavelia sp.]